MNVKQLLGAVSATIIKIAVAAVVISVVFRLAVYAYDFGYKVFADVPWFLYTSPSPRDS